MTDSSDHPPRSKSRTFARIALALLVLVAVAGALLYRHIAHGALIARQTPSRFETVVARALVDLSVPDEARRMANPLGPKPTTADLVAGHVLYQKNCESCHGTDGRGRTSAGVGMYPTPLTLGQAGGEQKKRTDGELFYFIRNGVRMTGMPGWQFPDQQIWQLVSFIRSLPPTAAQGTSLAKPDYGPLAQATYVGSSACKDCHTDIYERWKKTPMANVVRDPREHPEAITPDLSQPNPLVKFTAADVNFVYGSLWKQRYFKKVGDDYFAWPAQWDVTHKQWKPYVVKDDWWVKFYPGDNFQRPTSALCDGCHSVNYDIKTHAVAEWNVGCEKCHGPGSAHVKDPVANTIVNPARQDYVAANDGCIQCHSQGRPPGNPIEGKYYDWPVGYDVTKRLSDFWQLEEHQLGETTFTHFADGTAHKNRMQGNDYVTSQMYAHGVACYTCHDTHGTANYAQLRKPAAALCLDCHTPGSANGPHTATLQQHTHHAAGSKGSDCIECHMPKIAQTIGDVNVRSHTFRFVPVSLTAAQKVPNACNACHTDKSVEWTTAALKSWPERSSWRVTP